MALAKTEHAKFCPHLTLLPQCNFRELGRHSAAQHHCKKIQNLAGCRQCDYMIKSQHNCSQNHSILATRTHLQHCSLSNSLDKSFNFLKTNFQQPHDQPLSLERLSYTVFLQPLIQTSSVHQITSTQIVYSWHSEEYHTFQSHAFIKYFMNILPSS